MNIWKTLPFTAAILVAQATSLSAATTPTCSTNETAMAQPANVPLYRVVVVQGSATAINYRNLKSSTYIDLLGTVLASTATGEAQVKSKDGSIQINAKFKGLPPASTFGEEYLTYVLWGISPEGRATNLGEIILEHGKGKVTVTEKLQSFGLVVTAEPYFAVSQPSDVVVMGNAIRKGSKEQFEFIDAKYELLKRGQYTLNLTPMQATAMDEHTPFSVYQARNAVRIAQASGAAYYAPEALGKAQSYLAEAEVEAGGKKSRQIAAREAVQRAEDARLISVQKQEVERVARERKDTRDRLEAANRATDAANAATAASEVAAAQQSKLAEAENAGLRDKNAGLQSRNEGLQSRNADLRTRLMVELNAVLQTRATARGLIVNMSGVLFQNGQATLLPAAREKLAKIAGILSTHKGLKIEAEGFTDSNGSDASNQKLSEKRAQNSRDYLIQQGVKADAITFKGFGPSNPIASNDTAQGRQENRRVELILSGEGLTPGKTTER